MLVRYIGCFLVAIYSLMHGTGALSDSAVAAGDPYLACLDAPLLEPTIGNREVLVKDTIELGRAVYKAEPNTTILLAPGKYKLTATLAVVADNLTIRGASNDCGSVELIGAGMDNVDHDNIETAFWIGAANITIANMTISDVFLHPFSVSGRSSRVRIFNVRMINAGQQFVKVNPISYGVGVDGGSVEYSIMQYTNGPPTVPRHGGGSGYTNGVDIHAGKGWKISNNVFKNFHTPDSSDSPWNPAVLVWNGAADTITENNVFIDTDRAIAYGLTKRNRDHQGGIIRNNMVVLSPGLFSAERRADSDAPIIIWNSPGTVVVHNTILNNNNAPHAVEVRFDKSGVVVSNNLSDALMGMVRLELARSACGNKFNCTSIYRSFDEETNQTNASPDWFINPAAGDLRLKPSAAVKLKGVSPHPSAPINVDGAVRGIYVAPGADSL